MRRAELNYDTNICDNSKKPVLIQGVVYDITEHKNMEEAIRKSRDELEMHVKERTAELTKSSEELLNEITKHKKMEEELKLSELKLQEQKQSLEQKSIALKEILEQIEIE